MPRQGRGRSAMLREPTGDLCQEQCPARSCVVRLAVPSSDRVRGSSDHRGRRCCMRRARPRVAGRDSNRGDPRRKWTTARDCRERGTVDRRSADPESLAKRAAQSNFHGRAARIDSAGASPHPEQLDCLITRTFEPDPRDHDSRSEGGGSNVAGSDQPGIFPRVTHHVRIRRFEGHSLILDTVEPDIARHAGYTRGVSTTVIGADQPRTKTPPSS